MRFFRVLICLFFRVSIRERKALKFTYLNSINDIQRRIYNKENNPSESGIKKLTSRRNTKLNKSPFIKQV